MCRHTLRCTSCIYTSYSKVLTAGFLNTFQSQQTQPATVALQMASTGDAQARQMELAAERALQEVLAEPALAPTKSARTPGSIALQQLDQAWASLSAGHAASSPGRAACTHGTSYATLLRLAEGLRAERGRAVACEAAAEA